MRTFVKPGFWLGIWIFGLLLCVLLSVITPPNISLDVSNSDKIGHFLAYGTLSAWAVMLFRQKRTWILNAVALNFFCISMEIWQ